MDFSILTRRIGPLPGWAWGGLVAVGVWWFFIRGKGTASTTGTGTASATPGPDATYGLGFAQGQQAATASAQPATAQPAGPKLTLGNPPDQRGIPVWSLDKSNQGVVGYVQPGQIPYVAPTVGFNGEQGYSVPWGSGTGWVSGQYVTGIGGAGGIGGPARKHSIGARSRAPEWHDAHPLIGQNVRYAHYVRAVGGPGNHAREVGRVARQAGVHPARVAMLNPEYTGRIRVA